MLDETRRIFYRIAEQDFRAVCRDDMYVTCLVFCAETCCALGDADARSRSMGAATLRRANSRTSDRRLLRRCRPVLGHAGLRREMSGSLPAITSPALSLNRTMRAWPCLARTLFRYGAFLVSRQTDADRPLGRNSYSKPSTSHAELE